MPAVSEPATGWAAGAIDLGDPDLYVTSDRHRRWRDHAAADRVLWSAPGTSPGGFWSVFSYRDCRSVLAPTAPFTSEYGMMIGFDAGHRDRSGSRMLVVTEGDRHAKLRRLITPFLSRVMAAQLRDFILAEVRRLVTGLLPAGTVDAAVHIGPRLPAAVVCELLGVPAADRTHLIELTNHAFGGADSAFDKMSASEAHSQILMYFWELIQERRRRPGEDLVSALLADPQLSVKDVLVNCDNVLVGGNETTRHAVTGCFHALGTAPGLLDGIAGDPAAIEGTAEEIIRWTSPAMHVLRVATADTIVSGQPVRAGEAVVAWLPAANRDERVFPAPDRLDPSRRPNPHLGFGHGFHHCLGAALARAELAGLLEVLAAEVSSVRVLGVPQWMRSNLVQGYRRLDVEVRPRISA